MIPSVTPIARPQLGERVAPETAPGFGANLDALLRPASATPAKTTGDLTFSRHAAARLESRGLKLDTDELADLSGAVERLAGRGAKESLVLMGDMAFVVGVPDRKVITCMTRQEAAGNIFTQIDSTIVLR